MDKAKYLATTTAYLAVVALAACHANKQASASSKEDYNVEAAGSVHSETTARSHCLSRLSLDIDSFELVMPTYHFDNIGKLMNDTAMILTEQFARDVGQPRSRSVVLRGKHASIGKADIVQQNTGLIAHRKDTMSIQRTNEKKETNNSEKIAVTKPPDTSWWPWLFLAGAIAALSFLFLLKKIK